MKKMNNVSLAVIRNNGKYLSVSRKTNHSDLGFPGGKSENNETSYETLIREVFEETGLTVITALPINIIARDDIYIHSFEVTGYIGEIDNTKESGLVKWVEAEELYSENCSFKIYNEELFRQIELKVHPLIRASNATDIETFMKLICPVEWHPIVARIIETGVKFDPGMCKWLIGWSDIPNTKKIGENELETALKTCMFKMHDCFHQLWGIPISSKEFTEDEFYISKRAQMCGEISVLTMTEFMFAKHLWDTFPEVRIYLEKRNSLKMYFGVLKGKTPVEIAMRLDDVLHKKRRPKWMRDDPASMAFADDYVPMLQRDRENIDHNWEIMKKNKWVPENAPNIRYSPNVDGLELTIWMITDFYHLLKTDDKIDYALAEFNHNRRQAIQIPEGWKH